MKNEFDFKYPELNKKTIKDEIQYNEILRLEIEKQEPDYWLTNVYSTQKKPFRSFYYDFEILSHMEWLQQAIEILISPENHFKIKPDLKFIPFGSNGGGEYYCFFLTEQNGDDIPIVFVCNHGEAIYLAKNLQDFIFKVLVSDMSGQNNYSNDSNEQFKNNLKNLLKAYSKYLTGQQTEILQNLFSREIIEYDIEDPYSGERSTNILRKLDVLKNI